MGGTSDTEGGCFRFQEVSIVAPPKCDVCGATLIPASDTEWMCPTDGCLAMNIPQNLGIYPIRSVR